MPALGIVQVTAAAAAVHRLHMRAAAEAVAPAAAAPLEGKDQQAAASRMTDVYVNTTPVFCSSLKGGTSRPPFGVSNGAPATVLGAKLVQRRGDMCALTLVPSMLDIKLQSSNFYENKSKKQAKRSCCFDR